MAVTSQEPSQETTTDRFPLLMERVENNATSEHIIDIERVGHASLNSSDDGFPHGSTPENGSSDSGQFPVNQSPSSSNGSNYRSSSLSRTGEGLGRH